MDTRFNQTTATTLAHDWWIFLVRGIVAVLFGFLAFIWPQITLFVLVLLFGIFAVVDGLLSLARAFGAGRIGTSWVWPLVGGVLGIAAGVAAFVWPHITALVLLYIIAAWAVVTGICAIIAGITLFQEISNEWLLIVGGVISVLFGLLVFLHPGAGALALVWLIGFYAIVLGVAQIALALRLRDWQHREVRGGTAGMPPTMA
jgi:uncharacterized membrane protein HdeD (DUF308 family)